MPGQTFMLSDAGSEEYKVRSRKLDKIHSQIDSLEQTVLKINNVMRWKDAAEAALANPPHVCDQVFSSSSGGYSKSCTQCVAFAAMKEAAGIEIINLVAEVKGKRKDEN